VDQAKVPRVAETPEELGAAPQHQREDHEPVLVDEVGLSEGVEELGAAEQQDVAACLSLELRDILRGVTGEDGRIGPRRRLQGLRHHVLGDAVHAISEPHFVRGGRPERGEDLVGDPPQQDCVRFEKLVDLEPLLILSCVLQRPGVASVAVLVVSRRLHDAVECHEL
jgi:hypothetical protein